MAKKARLEIRINETDKELLRKVAEAEDCTITALLEDCISDLIKRLCSTQSFVDIKPNDSDD